MAILNDHIIKIKTWMLYTFSQRGIYYFMTNSNSLYAKGLDSYGKNELNTTTAPDSS